MRVLFLPEVEEYLFDLIQILYHKDYWGFYDTSINYVTELVEEIELTLSLLLLQK